MASTPLDTRAKLVVIMRISSYSLPQRAMHFLRVPHSSLALGLHQSKGKQLCSPENSQPVINLTWTLCGQRPEGMLYVWCTAAGGTLHRMRHRCLPLLVSALGNDIAR
jgi:hypothetical protein